MSLRHYLNKPEYRHRPAQIPRRLWRGLCQSPETAVVQLPWGLNLRIHPRTDFGRAVWLTGAFELPVSELIWRLVGNDDVAVDVGANLGYHTSVMAARVQNGGGRVVAFEPHPALHAELAANVARWPDGTRAKVNLRQAAVSDHAGEVSLHVPAGFQDNRGVCSLESEVGAGAVAHLPVAAVTLDEVLAAEACIRLLKLDVEGHEPAVLRGARALLESGRVRNWIFEEHAPLPSAVSKTLEACGYVLCKVVKEVRGPRLEAWNGPSVLPPYEAPNYLATLDRDAVGSALEPHGWHCLG